MAIDTEAKRKSVIAISFMPAAPTIVPSGTLELADRQTIGYGYYGIAAGGSIISLVFRSRVISGAIRRLI